MVIPLFHSSMTLLKDIFRFRIFLLYLSGIIVSGILFSPLAYLLFIVFILHRFKYSKFDELLIAYYVIIFFSDSRLYMFGFTYSLKILITILMGVLSLKLNQSKLHSFTRAFSIFTLIALVSILLSPIPLTSTSKTISYCLILFNTPIYINAIKTEDIPVFLKKLILTVVVLLTISLIGYFTSPDLFTVAGRFRGFLGNANAMGLFLSTSAPILLYTHNKFRNSFTRTDWILIALVYLICLILCGSRTAIMTFLILLIFYMLRLGWKTGLVITAFFIYSYQYLLTSFVEIFSAPGSELLFRVDTLQEAGGRIHGFNFAWDIIKKDWMILGKGFEYSNYIFGLSFDELAAENHVGNAHNSYLTAWLEVGLIGAIALLVAWVSQFVKAAQNSPVIYPTMFAIAFSSFFESWLAGSLNPYTILLIVLLSLAQRTTKPQTAQASLQNV